MAINRELSQFGRLVEINDGSHIGIGTTSNVNIGFGTITATTITATSFVGDGSGLTGLSTFSGSYNDLTDKPTIPTNNNELTNGAGYITASSTDTLTNKTLDAPTFTGNATFDANTLYVDSTNNRIGVGTDAPAYQFEIENTGANALLVLDRTDGAACFIEGQETRSAFGSINATPLALAYNSAAVVLVGASGSIRVNPDGDGYTFPTTDGSANQFLQTDGDGNLSFATVSDSVVYDTTPQLGGNLDLNSNDITGTGNLNIAGIITATSFVGDGSNLINVGSASSTWRVTSSGIHTLGCVGIGTEARSAHALTISGTGSTALFVDGSARITGILSIGTGTVTIDGNNSTITATNFVGELTTNFPSGDYGDFSGGSGVDAFGQVILDATLYDLLDTPSNALRTEDLGVLD